MSLLITCLALISIELLCLITRCWMHARVNLCVTSIIKIYHGLTSWYVITVFNRTSNNESRLKP